MVRHAVFAAGSTGSEQMLRTLKLRTAACCFSICCMIVPSGNVASAWQEQRSEARPFDGTLSVLTYNVKGLPWPLATGRPQAFSAMAERLKDMRAEGRSPQIVVLQEAFTDDAQNIGREAGYRYVAYGPGAEESAAELATADDRLHLAGSSWLKGETGAKLLGSGLQILSDYPVLAVRSMAFPAFACAGFDCLANKGAVMVTLDVPGAPAPVDIVTTHLNCRRKSGVSVERSLYAYKRQVARLSSFIAENHNPDFPLIVAGDFNVGKDQQRKQVLSHELRNGWHKDMPAADALRELAASGYDLPDDARRAMGKAKDWQFFMSGRKVMLSAKAVDVPFGTENDGGMLSDHVGYTAVFRLRAVD